VTDEKITKGERDELRRVVRGDFKALGMEVDVRRAEMLAEIERRVAARFRAHEEALAEVDLEVMQIVNETNARIAGLLNRAAEKASGYDLHWVPLSPPRLAWQREKRDEMRRAMIADLDARVAQARASMARQETDLLKSLSTGALESAAAHAFLTSIPKVAELVPDSRLAELEASFDDGPDDGPSVTEYPQGNPRA
jgi:hypothetical protein